ncbi:MAG: hypothetical protein V4719_10690 [Planctomycetota bacterium]
MAETAAGYPRRPKFFAYKLTRMMFKTALANDIGPEACHLIIQIAHTEDATRYCKAVTFYNEQLLPVCGFTNVKSLDRARAKAVRSGWLVYLPGGKSKPGKYWTTIPEQYIHLDDSSIDESNSSSELMATKEDTTSLPAAGNQTAEKREVNGRQEPEKRELNARETPEKWATINPTPDPRPDPIPEYTPPSPQGGMEQGQADSNKPSKIRKPAAPTEHVKAIYDAYPRKVAPEAAYKAIAKALTKISFPELLPIVQAYSRARKQPGQDYGLTPYPASWFNAGRWNDDPAEWSRCDHSSCPRGRPSLGGGPGQTHNPNASEIDPHHGKF